MKRLRHDSIGLTSFRHFMPLITSSHFHSFTKVAAPTFYFIFTFLFRDLSFLELAASCDCNLHFGKTFKRPNWKRPFLPNFGICIKRQQKLQKFLMGPSLSLFVYFCSFQQQFDRKIVDLSRIRSRIVRIEAERADHSAMLKEWSTLDSFSYLLCDQLLALAG